MKNQLLFLAFFALFLISKAQNTPQGVTEVIVIVLTNEDKADMDAVIKAVVSAFDKKADVAVAQEEATIIVPNEEETVVTVPNEEVTFVVNSEGATLLNEETIIIVPNEEAVVATFDAVVTSGEVALSVQNTVIELVVPSGPPLTIQALPIPQNEVLLSTQAADNYRRSASILRQVNGNVLIRNPAGTTSIVNASDLASDLSDIANHLSGSNGSVVVPNGGNIEFLPAPP